MFVILFGHIQALTVHTASAHIVIIVISIGSPLESIGTRFSHSIDTTADEVRLTDIERGNHYLYFFNGIHGDRISTAG